MKSRSNIARSGMVTTIISFIHLLREHGLHAGIKETIDVLNAAGIGTLESRNRFKFAMRALCCSSPEEVHLFNRLFDEYWTDEKESLPKSFRKIINPNRLVNKKKASIVMMGEGKNDEEQKEDAKNTSGSNTTERLRKTDFSKVAEIETELLEQIARKLFRQMSHRIRRRLKNNAIKKRVDFRRTFRRNIEKGGMPLELLYKGQIGRAHV